MSRAQRLTIGYMQVACSTQRRTFSFQRFIHARQPRSDHRLVQRLADQTWQPQPQLPFTRGFLPTLVLGSLVHGGFLLLPNPIFPIGRGLPPLNSQQPSGHRPVAQYDYVFSRTDWNRAEVGIHAKYRRRLSVDGGLLTWKVSDL